MLLIVLFLHCTHRRRIFAGAERGSRLLQIAINGRCERVRATEHAPRSPFHLLERRRGLAEIVERGVRVCVERPRVVCPKVVAMRATPRNLAWLFSPDLPKEIAWRVFAYWNPRH